MLHTISSPKKTKKRIGRGGNRGKNAGRGDKGQKSRAGHCIRPAIRDVLQRIPKLRGHGKNRSRGVRGGLSSIVQINLTKLAERCKEGDTISPKRLEHMGLIGKLRGKTPTVKVLSVGDITKAIHVYHCSVSARAADKIIKAGGSVHGGTKKAKIRRGVQGDTKETNTKSGIKETKAKKSDTKKETKAKKSDTKKETKVKKE